MKFLSVVLLLCLPHAALAGSSLFDEKPLGRVLRTTRVIPVDLGACKDSLKLEGRDWFCEPGSEQYDEQVAGGKGRVTRDTKVLEPTQHCMVLFTAHANGYKIQALDYYSAQTLSIAQARDCLDLAAPKLPGQAVITADYVEGQHPVPAPDPILYRETTEPAGQALEVKAHFSVKEASRDATCRTGGGPSGYGTYRAYRDCQLKLEDAVPGFADHVVDWERPEFGDSFGCSADLDISAVGADGNVCNENLGVSCRGTLRFTFDVYKENMMLGATPPTPGMGAVKLCASARVHRNGDYQALVFRYPR